jgi:hypothetical protein
LGTVVARARERKALRTQIDSKNSPKMDFVHFVKVAWRRASFVGPSAF